MQAGRAHLSQFSLNFCRQYVGFDKHFVSGVNDEKIGVTKNKTQKTGSSLNLRSSPIFSELRGAGFFQPVANL